MAQQQANGDRSITNNPPPPSLSRLPPELKEQIWFATCPPRRIMVYRVMEFDHPLFQDLPNASIYDRPHVMHLAFNATIFNSNDRPQFFLEHKHLKINAVAWKAAHTDSIKPPPGPVALQVCRESRAICLSRYELAFAPASWTEHYPAFESGPEWRLISVGKPRLWVDFTRDEILMDEPHNPMFRKIRFWEFAAKEELKKIRALGIGIRRESMTNQRTAWRLDSPPSFRAFEVLQELTIYARPCDPTPETPELTEQWKTATEMEIRGELERSKRDQPDWTADLPQIKVIPYF